MLRQWRDRGQGSVILGALPVGTQRLLVLGCPLHRQPQLPRGQRAAQHRQRVAADRCFSLAVGGVEVRWPMLTPSHRDDDSVEDADPRHVPSTIRSPLRGETRGSGLARGGISRLEGGVGRRRIARSDAHRARCQPVWFSIQRRSASRGTRSTRPTLITGTSPERSNSYVRVRPS